MIVFGRNSVVELLRASPGKIRKIMVAENFALSSSPEINGPARKFGLSVFRLPRRELTAVCESPDHQGIAAEIEDFSYSSLRDILDVATQRRERSFIVVADHVEDPRNLGAIVRTADFLGVHGIVIPADRACEITPTVVKVSSGATAGMKIAREINLGRAVDFLRKNGVWIVGADAGAGETVFGADLADLDIAVVVGNEGRGMSGNVKRRCDFLLSVPRAGNVESLNVSVASGIFLYEAYRQRKKA